jgi:hypothetical protein
MRNVIVSERNWFALSSAPAKSHQSMGPAEEDPTKYE